jgi:hypothetical protein
MCNCGNKRNEFTTQSPAGSASKQPIHIPTQKMSPDINFMYTGQSALTVTGRITGKQYRFSTPGDRQLVDYRDASSMLMVPVLKRI